MSEWGAAKAKRVFAALLRIGWAIKGSPGSHFTLSREGWPDYACAFHGQRRDRTEDDVPHRATHGTSA